jgi:uncharacterized protein YecE (DUF72 family)
MRFHVGTSGYSFKEWKGNLYPETLPQKQMLSYYAERFSTVEINSTFHRFPSAGAVKSWAEQVPASFRFVLKARQSITHFRRLKNAESQVDDFLELAALLKKRQGPFLFQLPPNFKKDIARLDDFLKYMNGRAKAAFEFRHTSWFDDETYECLRGHAAALCVADADDLPAPDLVRTANWGYVRLREDKYTDSELRKWIRRIVAQKWASVFVFFKHEDEGAAPKLASRFMKLADA